MKQTLKHVLPFLLFLLSWNGQAELVMESQLDGQIGPGGFEHKPVILPVDDAFRFGSYTEGSSLKMFWQVMPGYFLYRDKIEVRNNGQVLALKLPGGVLRQDEVFGEVMVLDGLIELQTAVAPEQELEVRYQGCAEQGYCYPPQKKTLSSFNVRPNPLK